MAGMARRLGNREKLLRAAVSCLRDRGYAQTTARDLVAASGANLASIGYHFGSKEALLNEATAQVMTTWMREIGAEAFGGESTSTRERFSRMLELTVDRYDELEPYLVSFVEAFPPAVRSGDLRRRMADAYQEAREIAGEMLRESLEADGVSASAELAERLAGLMMALWDGLILQGLLDRNRVPGSNQLIEALEALAQAVLTPTPPRSNASP